MAQALLAGHEARPGLPRWDPAYLHAQAALKRLGVQPDHALLAAQIAQVPRDRRVSLKPLAAQFLRAGLESPSPS